MAVDVGATRVDVRPTRVGASATGPGKRTIVGTVGADARLRGMKGLERRSTVLLQAPSCVIATKRRFVVGTLNRPSVKTRNTSVAAGIDKRITGNTTIGGVVYTPAALKAVFLNANAAIDSAEALHKQWEDQVLATKAAVRTANAVFLLLRSYLVGQYGANAKAILNDFGMEAAKARTAKTVAAKAAAVGKRDATRAVRRTMGKVQKKSVKGTVEVPVAHEAPTAPTPPPATSPAKPTS
jgi:hypothetical protein